MTNNELDMQKVYNKALALMDLNIGEKLKSDDIYVFDEHNAQKLEEKYEALPIINQHRWIINDYHACICSKMSRANELAYLAGVEAVINLLIARESRVT